MWKRLNSNQMCKKCSYKEVFLIKRFLIERFYCIYINIYMHNSHNKEDTLFNSIDVYTLFCNKMNSIAYLVCLYLFVLVLNLYLNIAVHYLYVSVCIELCN